MFLDLILGYDELSEEESKRVQTLMNLIIFFKELGKDQYFDYSDSYGNHLFDILEDNYQFVSFDLSNSIYKLRPDQQKLAKEVIPNYQVTEYFCRDDSESVLGFETFKAFCFVLQHVADKNILLDILFNLLDSLSSLSIDMREQGEKIQYEKTAFSNSKDYMKSLSDMLVYARNRIY